MIVTETVAAEAYAPAMTEERVLGLWDQWFALPEDSPLKRVEDLVLDLSQDVFWAGRLIDIEYRLWEFLCLPELDLRRRDAGTLTPKEMRALLSELRALTIGAEEPWWFAFDLDRTPLGSSVARQVPLAVWMDRHPEGLRPAAGSLGAGA